MYDCVVDLVIDKKNIEDLDGLKEALSGYDKKLIANECSDDVEWFATLEEDFEYRESLYGCELLDYYSPSEVRADVECIVYDYVSNMEDVNLDVFSSDCRMLNFFEENAIYNMD